MVLPRRERWRLYEWLRERAVYLDIETDSFGQITVVGCYGRGRFTSFVRGESLDHLHLVEESSHYDLLVTFCGTTFDVPMLLAQYPSLPLDQPHIDLCFMGRQLTYRGGLMAIEAQLLCLYSIEFRDDINASRRMLKKARSARPQRAKRRGVRWVR